jgi:hypothetical protein
VIPILVLHCLAVIMFSSAAQANFLQQRESLLAGFKVRQVFSLVRKAPAAYFLVLIGQLLSIFIAFFGLVGCVIGVLVTTTYSWSVMGHLYGQAYNETLHS